MTNAFCDRVIRKGIVDTRKYRYVIQRDAIDMTVAWIFRLPLDNIGDADCWMKWKSVKRFSLKTGEYTEEYVKWLFGGVC